MMIIENGNTIVEENIEGVEVLASIWSVRVVKACREYPEKVVAMSGDKAETDENFVVDAKSILPLMALVGMMPSALRFVISGSDDQAQHLARQLHRMMSRTSD